MEYLVGSLTTFILLVLIGKNTMKNKRIGQKISLKYSQTHIFEIVKPLLPPGTLTKQIRKTQSLNHEQKTSIKVIIMEDQAFWIKDNIFYVADMDGHHIDKDTTRRVDTMAMDKVELDKMLFIMDQLRDRKINDSGSSGN